MKKIIFCLFIICLSFSTIVQALTLPNTTLKQGDTSIHVTTLQKILNSLGYNITIPGQETNYFGNKTLQAIKDIQCKYSIVCTGSTSHGVVGPQTRNLLSTLPTKGSPIAATTDGLVGYWSFDGNASDSQVGNNGTVGGAVFTTGRIGEALSFDGVNDYVGVPQTSALSTISDNGGGGMSLSFWIKPNVLGGGFLNMGQGSDSEWSMGVNTAGRIYFDVNYDGASDLSERWENQLVVNEWQHFVLTWNGSPTTGNIILYKNGVQQNVSSRSSGVGNVVDNIGEDFVIGSDYKGSAGLNGSMDEVRVYNRPLTSIEVAGLYSDTGSGTTQPPTTTYTLNINGSSNGTISSSPSGINCGSTCLISSISSGTTYTLTATPNIGYQTASWSGCTSSSGNTCTVTVNANTTVTPSFTQTQSSDTTPPTVSVTAPSGTVSGTVNVTANASDNTAVSGVQFRLDGVNLGSEDTTSPYSVSWNTTSATNGSHTLSAIVRDTVGNTANSANVVVNVSNTLQTYTLSTVSSNGTVTGSGINCGSDCSETVNSGSSITLSATPAVGYTFSGWSGGSCSGTGTCSVTMSVNTTVTANFTLTTQPPVASGDCSAANVRCVGSGQEYPTIQLASSAVQAGDTVLVSAGTYSENVTVSRDGASGNPITFVTNNSATVCGFDFTNRSHIRVIGFTVDSNAGTCTQRSGTVLINGTNNNYLEFWNNRFTDALYGGIRLGVYDFMHNSIVVGNTFSNFGIGAGNGSGVAVTTQGNNNLIAYNELYNMHPDGFTMWGSGNRWTNNYTHDFSEVSGGHSDFFQTGSRTAGWSYSLIEANFQEAVGNTGDEHTTNISNGQGDTYGTGPMTENIFRNNVWHNVSGGTIGINQSYSGPITYTRYYNNTTADASVNASNVRYGMTWMHAGTNYGYLFNNIEYESWGSAVTSNINVYCLSRDTSCNTDATVPVPGPNKFGMEGGFTYGMDYNLAYDPNGNLTDPNAIVTYAAPWTGQQNAQSNVNPQFINFGADDFHLNSNSPAIGRGGALTTVTSASGSGRTFTVADGGFFRGDNTALNQYGGNLVVGDTITVGTDTVTIQSVSGNTITTEQSFSWSQNDPVYFGSDSTPDIGAYPNISNYNISASLNINNGDIIPRTTNTIAMTVNDPSLVRYVEFYVNGVPVAVDNSAPYRYSWNTSGDANGSARTVKAVVRPLYASKTLKVEDTATITINDSGTTPTVPSQPDPDSEPDPTTNQSTLTISKSGTGNGTVTGNNIDCGTDCSEIVNNGTSVTLTATPSTGSTFSGWSGECSGTGICTVTVNSNTNVTANFDAPIDTTTPSITLTSPTQNATISGTVTLSAQASDNIGVVGVQFRLNGNSIGNELTTSPYSGTWDTRGISNGSHTLTAIARDAAGNTTVSSPVSITVSNTIPDTTAPVVSITSPANGSTVSGTITITASATDSGGIRGVTFAIDGTSIGSQDTSSPYGTTLNTTTLTNGIHTIRATAIDTAGNQNTTTISITVDNPSVPDPVPTSDDDGDGVLNSMDKCPRTPPSLYPRVNQYGCPLPTATKFDIKPNFTSLDLTSVSGLELGISTYGKISWSGNIRLLRDATTYDDSMNLDTAINIERNKVTVLGTEASELNRTATLTLYGLNFTSPQITRDGVVCPDTICTNRSYNNGTLSFNVTGFSTYEITETPVIVTVVPSSGGGGGSSGGGGGGGSTIVYTPAPANTSTGILTPTVPQTPVKPNTPATTSKPTAYKFTRTLRLKSTGNDVKQLQIFLNQKGFTIAKRGAGSKGKETTKFGVATRSALIKFQRFYKLPRTGILDVRTRNKVNGMR